MNKQPREPAEGRLSRARHRTAMHRIDAGLPAPPPRGSDRARGVFERSQAKRWYAGRCSFERDVGPTSSQRLEQASLCEDSHSTSDTYLAHSLSLSGPVECYSTVALYPEAEPDAARSNPIHVSI